MTAEVEGTHALAPVEGQGEQSKCGTDLAAVVHDIDEWESIAPVIAWVKVAVVGSQRKGN